MVFIALPLAVTLLLVALLDLLCFAWVFRFRVDASRVQC